MLHTDPKAFISMVEAQQARRGPVVEVFPVGVRPPTSAEEPPASPIPTVSVFPPSPAVPQAPVVDAESSVLGPSEAVAQMQEAADLHAEAVAQMQGAAALHAEAVAQLQEAAGLHAEAEQMRAMAPGSPLGGVPDEVWRQFVARLERESPAFSSSRHVGQYRQRRERLVDLGIDPSTIQGSARAQRAALDADLTDAYRHAAAGGLTECLGRLITVPGYEAPQQITLSGLLGVIQCAGLEGAVGWLNSSQDRKRYPHTTQVFLLTNGVF